MTRWRALIPREHGAWGFLACGVVAALLAAPSWPGVLLAVMLALGLCVHQGVRRGLSAQDRDLLISATMISCVCLLLAVIVSALTPTWWWMPLALATPFALGHVLVELVRREQHRRRGALESIVGITALAAGGGAVAIAGGASSATALQIAGMVSAYGACTVPYVRARLGRESHRASLVAHGLGLIAAGLAVAAGTSWCLGVAMLLLALRAGAAVQRRRPSPAAAGIEELLIGLTLAILVGFDLHR